MMKKVIAICLALALVLGLAPAFSFEAHAASGVAINATNFPDEAFRDYVSQNFDLDGNGYLSTSERGKVDGIYVSELGISNLKGVERFTNLKELNCSSNNLKKLDVSKNTALETLSCANNKLTSLILNSAVRSLFCFGNKLTKLDLSASAAISTLYCDDNALTELDVSGLSDLSVLLCGGNALTELDVSHNTSLSHLQCQSNSLTSLDVSNNPSLWHFDCSNNHLQTIDVTHNSMLSFLLCQGNELKKLNVSKNEYLNYLNCSSNALTQLDLRNVKYLNQLFCSNNNLTSILFADYDDSPLSLLNCSDNAITSLDLRAFTCLNDFYCSNNALTSIQISEQAPLRKLYCDGNEIPGLDISHYPNLLKAYSEYTEKTVEEGTVYYKYAWLLDDGRETSNDLKVDSATPIYTEITAKPTITKQPKNQTVGVGKKATFTVEATGMTAFQWQYRTSPEEAWKDVSSIEGKKATFTLTAKAKHDGYQYRCRVSNSKGNTYTAARTLTVITEKPSIVTQPKSQTVAAGKTAKFTVEASGKELSYQWYYRTSSTGEWKAVSAAAGKTASYSFTTAARHNGYQYRCKVTNPAGSIYTGTRTLTVVTEKPAITTQPKSQTVSAGAKATFTVKASGESLTYQWYYRTSSTGEWKAVSAAAGKTATYSLTVAARHNGYQYRCKVTNPMGGVYTKTVTLTVN